MLLYCFFMFSFCFCMRCCYSIAFLSFGIIVVFVQCNADSDNNIAFHLNHGLWIWYNHAVMHLLDYMRSVVTYGKMNNIRQEPQKF